MLLRLTWAKCFTVSLDLKKEVNTPLKTLITVSTDHRCGENWAVKRKKSDKNLYILSGKLFPEFSTDHDSALYSYPII